MIPILPRFRDTYGTTAMAGVAGLSSCDNEKPLVPSRVSIVRAPAYDQRVYEIVRLLLEDHRVDVRGRHVVVKPNLVEFEPESYINTNPLLVHAAVEAFRARGAASVPASPKARATAAIPWILPTLPATSKLSPTSRMCSSI